MFHSFVALGREEQSEPMEQKILNNHCVRMACSLFTLLVIKWKALGKMIKNSEALIVRFPVGERQRNSCSALRQRMNVESRSGSPIDLMPLLWIRSRKAKERDYCLSQTQLQYSPVGVFELCTEQLLGSMWNEFSHFPLSGQEKSFRGPTDSRKSYQNNRVVGRIYRSWNTGKV